MPDWSEPRWVAVGLGLGLLSIIVAFALWWWPRRARSSVIHWVKPTWAVSSKMLTTVRTPVLDVRWALRGVGEVQALKCSTKAPEQDWHALAWPKGTVSAPKDDCYTYINLIDGRPFNSTIHSPVDVGKPKTDVRDQAVAGIYRLRIEWSDADKPKKRRSVEFKHKVK